MIHFWIYQYGGEKGDKRREEEKVESEEIGRERRKRNRKGEKCIFALVLLTLLCSGYIKCTYRYSCTVNSVLE